MSDPRVVMLAKDLADSMDIDAEAALASLVDGLGERHRRWCAAMVAGIWAGDLAVNADRLTRNILPRDSY